MTMQRYMCNGFKGMQKSNNGEWYRVADVERKLGDLSGSLEIAQSALELLERDVMSALPGVRFMDPPDGGDVSLGEQVKRMGVEFQRLQSENKAMLEAGYLRTITEPLPQPPKLLPHPPSHEESYANNLTQALRERDTLREVLALLAPDLKAMAILYAQKGDHQRSQALHNICKSVGVV